MTCGIPQLIAAVSLGIAMHLGPAARACTMPDQLIMSQTMLNIHYPDATFVIGATWTLQKAGRLKMPDPKRVMARGVKRAELDERERQAALQALFDFKNAMHRVKSADHALSIVLVERMHRERIMPLKPISFDALGADPKDDLLIVTTEPALHAITRGNLTVEDAISLGVMRLYGTDSQKAAFAADFGEIGSQQLETAPLPALHAYGASSAWGDLLKRAARINVTRAGVETGPAPQQK